ncbi:MAG: opacity family porin [Moraxella sp.]|nr:opacity family porin [Moraxella sp.]
MKRFIFATMLVSACTLATTHANTTYIQANAGHSSFEFDYSGELTESTVSYGIAIGQAMENGTRYAVDYSRLADEKEQLGENSYAKAKIDSVGISGFYDFKNNTPITPYVGVRLSANRIGIDGENFILANDYGIPIADVQYLHYRDTQMGAGAVVGVQYQVAPNLAIDGAVEYNYLGKIGDTKVEQYGAKAGVRLDF